MKLTLTSYFLVILLFLITLGITLRWFKYKVSPSVKQVEEVFKIDRSLVKNAQENKTYFGTVVVTTKRQSLNWPKVEEIVIRDTLTVEEGGYFGVPN